MIQAAFVFGVIITMGIMVLLFASPRWLRQFMLRHYNVTSLICTGLVLWIHWGTMTGLMSATMAGLLCHGALLGGRWWWRIA